jgi:4-hydroxy-tetrahydrodipicolinate reductase
MTKVVIVGACGKMSSAVVSTLANEKDIKIIGGIEGAGHPLIGQPIGSGFIQANLVSIIKNADVVVEFSIPEIALENIKISAKTGKPYIIGTTGIKDIEKIKKYSKKIPILYSANYSLGVNLLYKLAETSAKTLKDFDVEIVEAHHKMKRDAPSGTAKKLMEIVREARGKRQEVRGKKQEVVVHSIRAGDIVGEHNVMFVGNGERLELIHSATSRNAFASGVLKAIRFIVKQKSGFYTMADVIS